MKLNWILTRIFLIFMLLFIPYIAPEAIYAPSLPPPGRALVQVVVDVVNNYLSESEARKAQDYEIRVEGSGANPSIFKGAENPGVTVALQSGEYTISTVNIDSRYSLSLSDDCKGRISIGEQKICLIILYNLPTSGIEQPQARLITYVINDNGGTNDASDFITHIMARNLFPLSYYGEGAPGKEIRLNGEYKIIQNIDARYNTTFSKQCSGNASDFRKIPICTIMNNDKTTGGGLINVLGEVVNDNGGIRDVEDFLLFANGENITNKIFITNERPGIALTTNPGWYDITEGATWGYSVNYAGDCFGFVKPWETKICKVINNDIPGNGGLLTIVQRVINDEEEPVVVEGPIIRDGAGGDIITGGANTGNVTGRDIITGGANTGNVTGRDIITGGANTGGVPGGLTGAAGGGIGGADIGGVPGGLTGAAGGGIGGGINNPFLNKSSYGIFVNSSYAFPSLIFGKEDLNGTEIVLEDGPYSVAAKSFSKNYTYSFSSECSDNIVNGQGKICFITADDLLNGNNSVPKLMVVHRVINNDGSGRAPASFASTVTGECLENCQYQWHNESLPLGMAVKQYHMKEGNYQVNHHEDTNYIITASENCKGHISNGDIVTCQLTIDDKPKAQQKYGSLFVKQRVINNNGGTATAHDFKIYVSPLYVSPNLTSFNGNENGTKVDIKIPVTRSEYIVSQEGPKNYTSYFSRDCANIIHEKETNLCLIISDDK